MLQWDDLKRASDKDGDGLISRKEFLGYIMGEEQLDAKGGFVDADRELEVSAPREPWYRCLSKGAGLTKARPGAVACTQLRYGLHPTFILICFVWC
jgi:hypothetical protein